MTHRLFYVFTLALALLLSACGGGGAAKPTEAPAAATAAPAPTAAPATAEKPTAAPTEKPAANSDWQRSVVRIVAEGSFYDVEQGAQEGSWSGSGFIIDEDGTIVTNNHVVTGAALLKVYLPNEDLSDAKEHRAKVIGASECSDLAVIKITDGGEYPYLTWYDGAIRPELAVRAAGYPRGDENLSVTEGIVSEINANGKTSWASVDSVLRHQATIEPGSSGGPLVATDTKEVVGINYRSSISKDPRLTNRFFAIGRDEATKIIDRLKKGEDVASIGVNGVAYVDDNVTGVYVQSVKSGSPADEALIQAGDLMLSLEGLTLASDGTMGSYCDIIRDRAGEKLKVRVFRPSTGEILEGQLNGRTLAVVQKLETTPEPEATAAPSGDSNDQQSGIAVTTNFTADQAAQIRARHDQLVPEYSQILFETFDQGERTKGRWSQTDTEQMTRRLTNNRYELTLKQPSIATTDEWSKDLGNDYMVEASVRFPSLEPNAMAGIVFDTQEDTDKAFLFVVGSDGSWHVYQDYNQIASGETPANFAINPETNYSLWVARMPDHVQFYFNGELVALMDASPYAGGKVGVAGVSYDGDGDVPATVYVDDVLVRSR